MFKKIIIISAVIISLFSFNYKSSEKQIEKEQAISKSQIEKILNVDFICQAPLETQENWKLHEESCEEAALLQAYLYETGQHMTKPEANNEILKMINWQIQKMGSHEDLFKEGMTQLATEYYKIKESEFQIIENATINDIKDLIDQGHVVIVPLMSKELSNPYYPYPGYHMLVAIGYTKDHIITNDNGTRKGKGFSYPNEKFQNAMNASTKEIYYLKFK